MLQDKKNQKSKHNTKIYIYYFIYMSLKKINNN